LLRHDQAENHTAKGSTNLNKLKAYAVERLKWCIRMAAEFLEKITPERRWVITAKALIRLIVLRGDKIIAPELGTEEGVIAPVLGKEKWEEINDKVFSEGSRQFYPWVKETFNIPVEDAVDADNFETIVNILSNGPEAPGGLEYIERTPERVVYRIHKCQWWDMYEELEVDAELRPCDAAHERMTQVGLKTINPKMTFKLTKALSRGDPYCEGVVEFKNE